jgi:hypothetical protein
VRFVATLLTDKRMRIHTLVLLACCALVGCGFDTGEYAFELQAFREFSANPKPSVRKYREVWKAYPASDVSDQRFFVATELMAFDPDNYQIYYRFVVEHLRGEDGRYRPYAVRALRNARGVESLALLFEAYDSRQDMAVFEALHCIKTRYEATKGVASLRGERQFIEKRVAAMRATDNPSTRLHP